MPGGSRKPRFVQLYTSKSYENRRADLVNPPENDKEEQNIPTRGLRRSSSSENLQKHVLSPRLVDAISKTTQVVWANTEKQEGLIGRSDIRLQTAVGMPVAMDSNGNMCCVVMFSGSHLQSTDDAVDFLHSISQSATSSSIPCLLPVFDPASSDMKRLPPSQNTLNAPNSLGEGVTARYVSLVDKRKDSEDIGTFSSARNLNDAPKDTFGIPMLPIPAELGGSPNDESLEVFDEASYGIWTTIMETLAEAGDEFADFAANDVEMLTTDDSLHVNFTTAPRMSVPRRERLEEFCLAFLGMSVFEMADVWIPAGDEYPDSLRHVMSVLDDTNNQNLLNFARQSESTLIKGWMGAVGRAYSSGNPVWSTNESVLVDPGRADIFDSANIQTVLAVPVFSSKEVLPTCVVSCYSLVRSGSVPFVLRFVQQALRLLWDGLDQVQPHQSIEGELWRDVAPADLGEMAADVEMQQHFMSRKRPRPEIAADPAHEDKPTNDLSVQLESVSLPNGDTVNVPLQLPVDVSSVDLQTVHGHLHNAVRSVAEAASQVTSDRVNTNPQGTKRAHVAPVSAPAPLPPPQPLQMPQPLPKHVIHSIMPPAPSVATSTPVQSAVSLPRAAPAARPIPSIPQSLTTQAPTQPATNLAVPSATIVNQNALTAAQQHLLISQAAANPTAVSYVSVNGLLFAATPVGTTTSAAATVTTTATDLSRLSSFGSTKVCRIEGCDGPCVSKRPYCTKHSGNRLCEHDGCEKCAQGATRFCIAHGGGRRCTYPGCDKGARDKLFCAAHGGGKRCKQEGCSKSAVGGSNLCTAHGGGRRCSVEGCGKSAQSSTKFCVKHGGGKKCTAVGCEKVARGRTSFCAAHGGGIRCKLEGCNRVAIGKAQLCRAHGGGSSRRTKNAPAPVGSGGMTMCLPVTSKDTI